MQWPEDELLKKAGDEMNSYCDSNDFHWKLYRIFIEFISVLFCDFIEIEIAVLGCNTILNRVIWIQNQYLNYLNNITHESSDQFWEYLENINLNDVVY